MMNMVMRNVLKLCPVTLAFLWLALPAPLVAQVPQSCAQIVRAASQAGASGAQIEQAMETLQDLIKNHSLQGIEYAKVGKELVGLQKSTLFSGSSEANAADWISITNSSSVNGDEIVEVIDSLSQYLRKPDGTALLGVEVPAAPGGSSSLMKELVSAPRSTFFRASGPRSLVVNNILIQGRAVTPGAFQAADVLVSTTDTSGSIIFAPGDLVLSSGDFVAFKEKSSSWSESELTAAFQAIVNQSQVSIGGSLAAVNSFTFVAEKGMNLAQLLTSDTGVSVLTKLSTLQAALPEGQQTKLDIQQTPF
jgi:hypothetical protein